MGLSEDHNRHIVNLWSYISGLSIIAGSIDSENKNIILRNYIQGMIKSYTLGIKQNMVFDRTTIVIYSYLYKKK